MPLYHGKNYIGNVNVTFEGATIVYLDPEIEEQNTDLASQDEIIANIASALDGKGIGSGNSVVVGEATPVNNNGITSITIPDAIGKDNILVSIMDDADVSYTSGTAYIYTILIQGDTSSFCIQSNSSQVYTDDGDGLIIYDKTTGQITVDKTYNEYLCICKYKYVAW